MLSMPDSAAGEPPSTGPAQLSSSLEEFQLDEQRRILDVVTRIRKQGLNETLSLPQIVVCGDQSAGKSLVLETLTEIPFPRSDSLCTRFATEITLQRASADRRDVGIIPDQTRPKVEKDAISSFSRTIKDFSELPSVIEAAKDAMGLGSVSNDHRSFFKDVLRIVIEGPGRSYLTLVDVSGLIQTETKGSTKEYREPTGEDDKGDDKLPKTTAMDNYPITILRQGGVDWVERVLVRSRGREIMGNYNPLIVAELFWEQSSPCCRYSMREMQELGQIMKDNSDFALVYNHYYTDLRQQARAKRLHDPSRESIKAATQQHLHRGCGQDHYSANANIEAAAQGVQEWLKRDMTSGSCEDALDDLQALYKARSKVFVANVVDQVIERHLIRGLDQIFSPTVLADLADEEVLQIAAEPVGEEPARESPGAASAVEGRTEDLPSGDGRIESERSVNESRSEIRDMRLGKRMLSDGKPDDAPALFIASGVRHDIAACELSYQESRALTEVW